MISRIWSSRLSFKDMKFRKGLNIVLANRSALSTTEDKRNGVGKSSLLEIVHFLLGGDIDRKSTLASPDLSDDIFGMDIVVADFDLQVRRSIGEAGRVYVEKGNAKLPIQPMEDESTKELYFDAPAWRDLLGRLMFGMPPTALIEKGAYLTFRSCLAYFARRQRGDGYSNWSNTHRNQRAVSWQVSLAFLLGLDWTAPLELRRVMEREEAKKQLSKALKQGMLGLSIAKLTDLRPKFRRAKNEVERLNSQLDGFKVVEEYESKEDEANSIQKEIKSNSNDNVIDREYLSDIQSALNKEAPPEFDKLASLYEEVGISLPGSALRRFVEVKEFHLAIIANRKIHLESEESEVERRIEMRSAEIITLSKRRNQLLGILRSGGALEQYVKFQSELTKKEAEYESLNQQVDLAEKLQSLSADLKVERANAEKRLHADVQERKASVEEAISIFDEISRELYSDPAVLDIGAGRNGLAIEVVKDDISSVGVKRVQVFTFDMMLSEIAADRGNWPGFLFHDSHIFDGVDGRQIATALKTGHVRSIKHDGQYIITMNSDDLEKAEREGDVEFNDYVVSPTLDDSPTGGLFGFRFSSPISDVDE